MQYFKECTTLQAAKNLFRKLALQHHPDRGGDVEIMKIINSQYARALAFLSRQSGKTEEEVNEEVNEELNLSEVYKKAINAIINLDGLIIELVGDWVWVTGNTIFHKETLKNAGFFFASKKKAWYFRTDAHKSKGSKKMNLDEIKNKYGSKTVRPRNKQKQIR